MIIDIDGGKKYKRYSFSMYKHRTLKINLIPLTLMKYYENL